MIGFIFKPHSLLYCLERSKSRSIIAWITAWWFWPVRRGIRWDQSANFSTFNCFNPPCGWFFTKSYWNFRLLPSENRATPFQWFVFKPSCFSHVFRCGAESPKFSIRCFRRWKHLAQCRRHFSIFRGADDPMRGDAGGLFGPDDPTTSQGGQPPGATKGGVVVALGSRWILGWDLIVNPVGVHIDLFHLKGEVTAELWREHRMRWWDLIDGLSDSYVFLCISGISRVWEGKNRIQQPWNSLGIFSTRVEDLS